MSIRFTSEDLERAYEFLIHLPPFDRWNLPDSHEVIFKITRHKDRLGDYYRDSRGRHVIRISVAGIGTTGQLVKVMAHEIIHLHQGHSCMETKGEHNAAFHKLAAEVCKHHHYVLKEFV